MEGLFFYVGFTQILALGPQNKMTGRPEQYQYILRDESMHCNFGIDLITRSSSRTRSLWTPESARKSGRCSGSGRPRVRLRGRHAAARARPERAMFKATCATSRTAARSRSHRGDVPQEENRSVDERDDRPEEGAALFETRVIEYQSAVRSRGLTE